MTATTPRPADAILRRFKFGRLAELTPAEVASVESWLGSPEAADEYSRIDVSDPIIEALGETSCRATNDTSIAPRSEPLPQVAVPEATPVVERSPELPADVPTVVGVFRCLRELGRGGMGVVVEAEDARLDRRVAVKLITPQFAADAAIRERFLHEARTVAKIEHDNVVPILQVGEDGGCPFLVMPLLKGETLEARLKREVRLTATEARRIGRDVAAGLAAAHAVGIIHRDIKPANIWLEAETGRARILDFGLAKPLERADGDAPRTRAGAVMGTPHYMAPEQAEGKPVDHRADLFSLGVVLYHAVTGKRPFTGDTVWQVLQAVTTHTPDSPDALNPDLPPQLAAIIRTLMAKTPADRPQSAALVAKWLTDADAPIPLALPVADAHAAPWESLDEPTEPIISTPGPKAPHPRIQPARRWKRATIAAVGVLMLLGISAFGAYKLYFETKEGTLVVKASGEANVRLEKGELRIYDDSGKLKYTLKANERSAKLPAGQYTVKVIGADGLELDTPEFKLTKNGEVILSVTVKTPAQQQIDYDRKAAEWVISVGGAVRINDGDREIRVASELPQEPFRLTWVHLHECKRVTDAGMAALRGCKHLKHLNLRGTQVGDVGVAHLAECLDLRFLDLERTNVTDTGMAHLKNCKRLADLALAETQVGDVGLAHFADCDWITLNLRRTKVSDRGLLALKNLRNVEGIFLDGQKQITDAAIDHLKDCELMANLVLYRTNVSDAKVRELAKALPHCKIEWGVNKVIERSVTLEDNRKVAEYVFSLGGTVIVNEEDHSRKNAGELPPRFFRVTTVELPENPQVNDASIAKLSGCKSLRTLNLSSAGLSNAGLGHLKDCSRLSAINLWNTRVGDEGLAHLKHLESLRYLHLVKTGVTRAGVEDLAKSLPRCRIEWGGGTIDPKQK